MSKILNFDEVLVDLAGEPMDDERDAYDKLTVGAVIAQALSNMRESKDPLRAHILAQKAHKGGEFEMNQSDAEFIKRAITQYFIPMVAGPALMLIEDAPSKRKHESGKNDLPEPEAVNQTQ